MQCTAQFGHSKLELVNGFTKVQKTVNGILLFQWQINQHYDLSRFWQHRHVLARRQQRAEFAVSVKCNRSGHQGSMWCNQCSLLTMLTQFMSAWLSMRKLAILMKNNSGNGKTSPRTNLTWLPITHKCKAVFPFLSLLFKLTLCWMSICTTSKYPSAAAIIKAVLPLPSTEWISQFCSIKHLEVSL